MRFATRRKPRNAWRVFLGLSLWAITCGAQEIPRDRYIRYMPLAYPSLVRESPATVSFALFGDAASADYVDVAPRDGIDDRRAEWLKAIAVRFAPYMVRNSIMFPMDWKRFISLRSSFPLFIDRWETSRYPPELARTDQVDFAALGAPCPVADGATASLVGAANEPWFNDCRLLALLRTFDPALADNAWAARASVGPRQSTFDVLFFDFPGKSPDDWKKEYQDPYAKKINPIFAPFSRAYVHPFVMPAERGPAGAFELALQYWFFYPTNDGDNKHEGDWEHINVVVSPRSLVRRALYTAELRALLARAPRDFDGPDPLVIRRIDYYFHHSVFVADFSQPNVYDKRADWEAQVHAARGQRLGSDAIYEKIRARAYSNRQETILNTHPIVYIGANSKGLELLISPPGGRNQDSHGSYPFPGFFKGVGAAEAAEEIRASFDLQEFAGTNEPWPSEVVRYDDSSRLELLPDWERIHDMAQTDAAVRRDFGWMLLPIRFGYPAMESTASGIVSHADTGNLSPVGPTFNSGWNRSGATEGYAAYQPNRFTSIIPSSPLDTISNSFGFLNIPWVLLTTLPPLDLVYRVVFLPVRALVPPHIQDVYTPQTSTSVRVIGFGIGASFQTIQDDWVQLYVANPPVQEIVTRLAGPNASIEGVSAANINSSNAVSLLLEIDFYLGSRFVTENAVRHSKSGLSVDLSVPGRTGSPELNGTLDMWEYSGSLRYNFLTGRFLPYFKLGYGLTWYRLEGITLEGAPLTNPNGIWIRKPSIFPFENIWPNTWHWGLGAEYILFGKVAPLAPSLSFKLDYSMYNHSLGLDIRALALSGFIADPSIHRSVVSLLALLNF
jgi:hypothetical protein